MYSICISISKAYLSEIYKTYLYDDDDNDDSLLLYVCFHYRQRIKRDGSVKHNDRKLLSLLCALYGNSPICSLHNAEPFR